MSVQEIIVKGSTQEIAQRIAEFPGQIIQAVLLVESGTPQDDAWARDFRQWAASQKSAPPDVDDSRESIYKDRLG